MAKKKEEILERILDAKHKIRNCGMHVNESEFDRLHGEIRALNWVLNREESE